MMNKSDIIVLSIVSILTHAVLCDVEFSRGNVIPRPQNVNRLPEVCLMASTKKIAPRSRGKTVDEDESLVSKIGGIALVSLSVASKKILGALIGFAVFSFSRCRDFLRDKNSTHPGAVSCT